MYVDLALVAIVVACAASFTVGLALGLGIRLWRTVMHRLKTLVALVALLAAGSAHADVLRVIEGPRQQHDKANCAAYRPIWSEFTRDVAGVGVFEFGPESPLPPSSADNVTSPEEDLAYDLWAIRAAMHPRYVDTRYISDVWTNAPILGYDQFAAAFAIAAEALPGQVGPRLYPPRLADYPHVAGDWETYRPYRIAVAVYEMSWRRTLSLEQLGRIEAVLLETPTCDGVAY